jgi:hypothetical protein
MRYVWKGRAICFVLEDRLSYKFGNLFHVLAVQFLPGDKM